MLTPLTSARCMPVTHHAAKSGCGCSFPSSSRLLTTLVPFQPPCPLPWVPLSALRGWANPNGPRRSGAASELLSPVGTRSHVLSGLSADGTFLPQSLPSPPAGLLPPGLTLPRSGRRALPPPFPPRDLGEMGGGEGGGEGSVPIPKRLIRVPVG